MAYTLLEISDILLKADKTIYRLGSIAYDDMFAEDSETLDYERDIIYLYKKSVEWADDLYLGNSKLDKVVQRLNAKVSLYDYGKLTPIYSDVVTLTSVSVVLGAGLTGSSDFSGSSVAVNLNYTYIKEQVRENYVHDQQTASANWVVVHNLNKYSAVSIVDTSNDAIMGEIKYNSLNQLTITFTAAISGKAYLN